MSKYFWKLNNQSMKMLELSCWVPPEIDIHRYDTPVHKCSIYLLGTLASGRSIFIKKYSIQSHLILWMYKPGNEEFFQFCKLLQHVYWILYSLGCIDLTHIHFVNFLALPFGPFPTKFIYFLQACVSPVGMHIENRVAFYQLQIALQNLARCRISCICLFRFFMRKV